jgi:hypothetical protein
MKKIIFSLILIQILIAVFLAVKIYKQKTNVLGEIAYSPIHKDDIIFNPDSELKFFYEPVANTIEENKVPLSSSSSYHTINSDSLNERYDYSIKKSANTCRIITLGDSFTFGAFVNTAENYPEKLEKLLHEFPPGGQKVEVINLGVGGYDIQYAVERYFLRGEKYDPDIILWFLKDDDFLDIREFTLERGDYYYVEMGPERMDQLGEVGIFPSQMKAHQDLLDTYGKSSILAYQEKQIEKLISSFNGKIIFLLLTPIDVEYKQLIKKFPEEYPENTYYLGLRDSFADSSTARLPDGHPNELGYELISKLIFEYLLEESLVPCN